MSTWKKRGQLREHAWTSWEEIIRKTISLIVSSKLYKDYLVYERSKNADWKFEHKNHDKMVKSLQRGPVEERNSIQCKAYYLRRGKAKRELNRKTSGKD